MANIALYAVGGTPTYYVLNDDPSSHLLRGSLKEQDTTPTFTQATEGAAGSTDVQPTAETVWRDLSGSIGLYKQSSAPGDLTRSFVSDADTTRANQITAWLRFGATDTVAIDVMGTKTPQYISALVNAAAGWGFVGASDVNAYWLWNGTKFAGIRTVQATAAQSWNSSSRLPPHGAIYASGLGAAPLIVQQTGTNLWMPIGGSGSTDISVAAAAGVGVGSTAHIFVYFDILFVIALTGGNLTITPYRPNTPATGNVLQSVTYTGLAACLGTIPGEAVCLGVVTCEGAVYIATDRSVYAMQWNDQNNTILTTKLFELPRITGAPVVWNGEVYIPADNRIAHITPGQRGYDWRTPDALGVLPMPYSATIVQLLAFSDALIAQVTDPLGTGGHCYLRMDANGIWSCLYHQVTNWPVAGTNVASGPMLPIVDGTNPQAIAFPNYGDSGTAFFSTMFVCPVPQTSRNPRALASTARKQRAGPFRTITPWYDLSSETAQKLLERLRETVLGVTAGLPVKVYYQTDYADEAGSDTFSSGCAKGTGVWHQCAQMVPSGTAYAGSVSALGNGTLWYEFDNATNYATVGLLPLYPTMKQVRFCIEINGDTTGTAVPAHVSLGFQRIEFVTKAYQSELSLRIRVNEEGGRAAGTAGGVVTYANAAAAMAAKNAIKALTGAKTPCTYVDETGTSRTVLITKYEVALLGIGSDGNPGEYAVTLSLQDIPLQGQN